MITIYGSHLCHNCRDLTKTLDVHGYLYLYKDITSDLANLKEFLKKRDTLPCFDEAKELGRIGIPCIVTEDNKVTINWEDFVSSKGMTPLKEEENETESTCSLSKKRC